MDTNKFKKLEFYKHFILKQRFFVGLVLGIILGLIISCFCGLSVSPVFTYVAGIVTALIICIVGNYIYSAIRKRLRGGQPYCSSYTSGGFIFIEAHIPSTEVTQTALSGIVRSTTSSDN